MVSLHVQDNASFIFRSGVALRSALVRTGANLPKQFHRYGLLLCSFRSGPRNRTLLSATHCKGVFACHALALVVQTFAEHNLYVQSPLWQ
jgi:hypothetical protein